MLIRILLCIRIWSLGVLHNVCLPWMYSWWAIFPCSIERWFQNQFDQDGEVLSAIGVRGCLKSPTIRPKSQSRKWPHLWLHRWDWRRCGRCTCWPRPRLEVIPEINVIACCSMDLHGLRECGCEELDDFEYEEFDSSSNRVVLASICKKPNSWRRAQYNITKLHHCKRLRGAQDELPVFLHEVNELLELVTYIHCDA